MKIRHAFESDLPRIVEIYNSTVKTRQSTADTQTVSIDSRRNWFRNHDKSTRPIMVCTENQNVLGWVSFESFYGRPAYRHTAEISIYIDQSRRGQGLGREILGDAVLTACKLGIKNLVAYVFSHNTPSLKLFESLGFKEWGRLPDIAEMDGAEYSLSILGKRICNDEPVAQN